MTARARGSFIVPCRQIEIDGVRLTRPSAIVLGATWRWTGTVAEIEAAHDLPLLCDALGEADVRRRAARAVRRMLAPVVDWSDELRPAPTEPLPGTDGLLTVSDGYRTFTGILVGTEAERGGYVVFAGRMPPARTELRVTRIGLRPPEGRHGPGPRRREIPCFVGGTMIATATGQRRVQDLVPGDLIETRDHGPRPLLWRGHRPVGEAEIVRILPNAFAPGVPLSPVLISPDHKVLVRHPAAGQLYGTREVLVAARDLVGMGFARFCPPPPGARYHHLLFAEHQVVWAAGVPCESLHPLDVDVSVLPDAQRLDLLAAAPEIYGDAGAYGPPVRRSLSGAEAAMLFHKPPVSRLGG